jgi:hypothetical protein
MTPVVADFVQNREMSRAVSDRQLSTGAPILRPFSEGYILGSWLMGGTMVGVGVLCGGRVVKPEGRNSDIAPAANERAAAHC